MPYDGNPLPCNPFAVHQPMTTNLIKWVCVLILQKLILIPRALSSKETA